MTEGNCSGPRMEDEKGRGHSFNTSMLSSESAILSPNDRGKADSVSPASLDGQLHVAQCSESMLETVSTLTCWFQRRNLLFVAFTSWPKFCFDGGSSLSRDRRCSSVTRVIPIRQANQPHCICRTRLEGFLQRTGVLSKDNVAYHRRSSGRCK